MSQSLHKFLLSQSSAKTPQFWHDLETVVRNEQSFDEKLNPKTKILLVDGLHHIATSQNVAEYFPIINLWISKSSDTAFFENNFTRSDKTFFSALTSVITHLLTQSYQNGMSEEKIMLISNLKKILSQNKAMFDQMINDMIRLLIGMFANTEEPQELYQSILAFLHHFLLNNESLMPLITENAQNLFDAAKEIQSPKTQIQLFNILWLAQVRLKEASFVHKDDSQFISSVHKIFSKINNGIKSFIITLQVQSAMLPDGTSLNHGWIDIGSSDLLISFDENILSIPFDSIDGLDADNTTYTIFLNPTFTEFGDLQDQKIIIKLSRKPTSKMLTHIFSRISKGESQPIVSDHEDNQSAPQQQLEHTSAVQMKQNEHIEQPIQHYRSSIAMYICDAQGTNQSSQLDECLFTDNPSSKLTAPTIETEIESDQDSIESPPPPSIAMNMDLSVGPVLENDESEHEEEIRQVKQKKRKRSISLIEEDSPEENKMQIGIGEDDFLKKHTAMVSNKISAGIDALTKQRMDAVNHFGEQIAHYVDVFKEDIKTTYQDRKHCSVKQLDVSRQKFQNNIQQFKKKEASMHQTLIGFEEETKQMSTRVTEIQRKMRNEIQRHRLELEDELKKLRKIIRKNDLTFDRSDEYDYDMHESDEEDLMPRMKNKIRHQINA